MAVKWLTENAGHEIAGQTGASTPLKHGRSLRPSKNEGGTKIVHIFVKMGGGRGKKD